MTKSSIEICNEQGENLCSIKQVGKKKKSLKKKKKSLKKKKNIARTVTAV